MSASAGTAQNNGTETLVGAIVVALAVIICTFLYFRPGATSSGYELTARLPRVDGLGVGTDVRLAGIKIGSVSDMVLDPNTYLVTVHLNIRDDVKIPEDSSLIATSSGILGSSYLSITPGGDDKMLAPGGLITNTQGSVDLMGLIGQAIGGGGGGSSSQPKSQPQQVPPGP